MEIKRLCEKYGIVPSKKYGQNFLVGQGVVEKMMEAGRIGENDQVLEVGPGFGVLTLELVKKAKKVVAFEIERKLELYWQEKMTKYSNLELIWGDVLKQQYDYPAQYKVVANLPYQITSAIIKHFIALSRPPQEMVIMVQKEVAERIVAKPGKMSVLAVAVQYFCQPEIICLVPAGCFWPEPKVDSAVILLGNIVASTDLEKTKKFFQLVKMGFASKRKKLFNNLLNGLGKDRREELLIVFKKMDLSENVRAQELMIGEWRELVEKIG